MPLPVVDVLLVGAECDVSFAFADIASARLHLEREQPPGRCVCSRFDEEIDAIAWPNGLTDEPSEPREFGADGFDARCARSDRWTSLNFGVATNRVCDPIVRPPEEQSRRMQTRRDDCLDRDKGCGAAIAGT